MNTKTEVQAAANSAFDTVKWVAAITLIGAGIYGYYHFDQYQVIYRVLALLPVVGFALGLAAWTKNGSTFWDLLQQARLEIYKVVWPNRQETTQTTMIVVLVVFLVAIVLWLLDMLFGWLASLIIG